MPLRGIMPHGRRCAIPPFPQRIVNWEYNRLLKTHRSEKPAWCEQIGAVNQLAFAGGIGVYCAETNSHLPAARSAT